MRIVRILLCLCAFSFVSCASTKFEGRAVLAGKVCDLSGKGIPNYHISAGLGLDAVTDINGMFSFNSVSAGNYHITGGGNGWESADLRFSFTDRKSIVCIQVDSLENLVSEMEILLEEENFEGAKNLLSKYKPYNERNPFYRSYKSLVAYCASPTEKRKEALKKCLDKIQ
ncbi:carboxypeptidase-like regulatory domain-containing protein [uncultured Treponema sp.]|uniref:carboxypeptidase-like regulatory domain-containing protein n=1 Tax=uncultured Treponema sp. TaxID=162155 RepID=UPI0025E4D99C|nr:carboxypeptidase-like regulatory domain-containing protein [uncultured Treponema sp.]